jgi:hypothetical protein
MFKFTPMAIKEGKPEESIPLPDLSGSILRSTSVKRLEEWWECQRKWCSEEGAICAK